MPQIAEHELPDPATLAQHLATAVADRLRDAVAQHGAAFIAHAELARALA